MNRVPNPPKVPVVSASETRAMLAAKVRGCIVTTWALALLLATAVDDLRPCRFLRSLPDKAASSVRLHRRPVDPADIGAAAAPVQAFDFDPVSSSPSQGRRWL